MLLTRRTRPRTPTLTRLRPGTVTDSYGDPVESWDEPDRLILRGADAQPVSSEEDENGVRHLVEDERRLFSPGKIDLTEDDRIEIADEGVWRVDGRPITRHGLASGTYTTATLRRLTD